MYAVTGLDIKGARIFAATVSPVATITSEKVAAYDVNTVGARRIDLRNARGAYRLQQYKRGLYSSVIPRRSREKVQTPH